MATSSDMFIQRNSDERTFFIGDRHALLFKYEICKMDRNGTVQETVSYIIYLYIYVEFDTDSTKYPIILSIQTTTEIECKWLPVKDVDVLPLNQLVSQSKYKRS